MFQLDWHIKRILHQPFEIKRPIGHWSEVVVHLKPFIKPDFVAMNDLSSQSKCSYFAIILICVANV